MVIAATALISETGSARENDGNFWKTLETKATAKADVASNKSETPAPTQTQDTEPCGCC